MKTGTPDHPKTKALARILGIPRYAAMGLLEALWHATAKFAPRGDIGRFSDEEISDLCYWDGPAAKLIHSLVKSGWLDSRSKGRLLVHDWHVHAEDAVNMRLARAGERFSNGSNPRLGRLPPEEKAIARAKYEDEACTRRGHGKHTPCTPPSPPIPSPPIHKDSVVFSAKPSEPETPPIPDTYPGFDAFWAAWPKHTRKVNRKGCLKHWRAHGLEDRADQIVQAVADYRRCDDWRKEGGKFIPLPATWLNQERWENIPGLPESEFWNGDENNQGHYDEAGRMVLKPKRTTWEDAADIMGWDKSAREKSA